LLHGSKDFGLAESDRAAFASEQTEPGEVTALEPVEHRSRGKAEQLSKLAGSEQPLAHPATRLSASSRASSSSGITARHGSPERR